MKRESCDICVIGSGAGGAVVAYEAARRGLRTIVLEQGPRIDADRMSTAEVDMIPRLYKDGGMQLSTSLDFFILQGACVGGSTTVSNMVLIRAGAERFRRWAGLGADIPLSEIMRGYDEIERQLGASFTVPAAASRSTALFEKGARRIGLTPRPMLKALGDCRACGNCNIGCSFGSKRSALTTFIPWAEEQGARVLADTRVRRLVRRGHRVSHIEATHGTEALRVDAKVFAVCAGPIGSSALLLASGVKRNVGTRLSFNAGAMMVADFDEVLDAYDADQMTSYVPLEEGLLEPTHNPIMSAALTTPGWMEEHAALMRRSVHLAYAGAMVPTDARAEVVWSPWFGHEETRFRPTSDDMLRLRIGLKTIARIFFAAGARRVLLPTEHFTVLESEADIALIDERIRSLADVQAGSSHPQGGNPMSDDPSIGVVDTSFAVHGLENAFVCDASIFPDALGVNPMNSVMALALHAAPKMVARA
jgi:choline dehydrogenase-like flavoprotein